MNHLRPVFLGVIALSCTVQASVDVFKQGDPRSYVPPTLESLNAQLNAAKKKGTLTADDMLAFSAASHGARITLSPATVSAPLHITLPFAQTPLAVQKSKQTARTQVASTTSVPGIQLTSLQNAATFIHSQRAVLPDGTLGLPATFAMAPGVTIDNPARDLLVRQGAGLYDTSLSILALTENGNLDEAGQILSQYLPENQSKHGTNLELKAIPSGDNGGAYKPFDSSAYYYFDFTRTTGLWSPDWQFWDVHTGPNAWLVLAIARYITAARLAKIPETQLAPYLSMAEHIANGMLALQTPEGGIRFSPKGTYHDPGTNDPYDEINSENNVSAYSAFNALAKVDKSNASTYTGAAGKILTWLHDTPVYNPATQTTQNGLMDSTTGLLYKGAVYQNGCWTIQPVLATDSGGTWAISSLGAAKIDQLWGDGAAYRMWTSVRGLMGKTAQKNDDGTWQMQTTASTDRLDGLDFTNQYFDAQSLISPEWTGGGINAVNTLADYYGNTKTNVLSADQVTGLANDSASMTTFLNANPNAYAIGPGLTSARAGNTGFGWISPPDSTTAMAAIYRLLPEDPLATTR